MSGFAPGRGMVYILPEVCLHIICCVCRRAPPLAYSLHMGYFECAAPRRGAAAWTISLRFCYTQLNCGLSHGVLRHKTISTGQVKRKIFRARTASYMFLISEKLCAQRSAAQVLVLGVELIKLRERAASGNWIAAEYRAGLVYECTL